MYKAVFAANCVLWLCFAFLLPSCTNNEGEKPASTDKLKDYRDLGGIAKIAPGWRGEIIAKTDQSYVGLDVEIGDADNDGKNEILTTGSPNSRLYLFQKSGDRWRNHILYENLARYTPGLGLSVEIVDLNADGKNEVICGTGHELNTNGPAIFYVFQTNGEKITK
ncbi:MAG: VCBS repeat-containing protein, partial [Thermodesulfovibrionia bacterium]|nr:VCBS repeat-containing protein [Thermodesulfovibrionia bacterium]